MDHDTAAAPVTPEGDNSTRCEACKSCGAILELDGCGHRFHPRCIFAWPATHCEVCDEPVGNVLVFRESKNRSNSSVRKGKWSIDEHKYANLLMKQFKLGALPLADGLHLRVFMANMLQCDPLRVTKKYTGQAIGKQNFFYQREKNYCYNLHVKLQKQLSNLRNHYYWHVQYRCKFGPNLNIQELKAAEADYWIREFCKFAKKIGQKVEFTTVSAAGAEAPSNSRNAATPNQSAASSLQPHNACTLRESRGRTKLIAKGEEDSSAPSMKDGVSLMLGFASAMDQSPSPLSADAWNDPSAFVDLTLANLSQEELSKGDASLKPCAKDILKKGNWMNDWMKEAELEWSKGAISWSLSLSAEPLADFA
ncbi:Zinc finger, RING/FYVE/PHD-type [Phytophthora cactorum]|nr:Zinc finger, RING/FYVE/PHD-type [Phytophthora cactorum]